VILTSDPLTPAEGKGEGVREEITSRKRRRKRRSFSPSILEEGC